MNVRIWVDDLREAPNGFIWCKTVQETISLIEELRNKNTQIDVIDLDHDAGDYYKFGGDYIKILDWLERKGFAYPIHIHSMNVVGRANMEAIIHKNGWHKI